jgi:predicted ATP-dependent Lon-type protease
MQLKLGSWAAGGEGVPEGTVQWAGGKTDFSQGPFDMYVKEVSITNYNPADSYEYGDKSGSWESIKINKDGSSSNAGSSGTSTTSSEPEASTTSVVASNTTVLETSTAADTQIAYTSQASVQPLDQHTEAANSVTLTGSMYSTNTASASALNSAINASTMETAIIVTTQVPDSTPTGSPIGYGNATETGNSTTHPGPSTSAPSPAEQSTNAGASLKSSVVVGSVVGLALGVLML